MKNLKNISILVIAVLTASMTYGQDKKANNIDNSNIALQGYSPVSYLDLGIAQKGIKEHKSEYQKVVYYFTTAAQKSKFDKNPGKYKPQYGGYCAFGVYAGAKFRPDPNKFIVQDGKYFLYLYNLELDAQQLWLAEKNHNKLVGIANKNWDNLSKSYN
ncbi:YHS domain-containing (seleno)protein [Spongiimicrobium sp. 3-5]|uniref:YHS domain-containing (seleno)protein n=1 Tax=Spongiimicrobium sp. 3-5 TaxID=3332596 RepID=UPI00398091F3